MQFLNGDLDQVFTVLYEMGKIEPMLQKDWKQLFIQSRNQAETINSIIMTLNELATKSEIQKYLNALPSTQIEALVVEVARELADFYDRGAELH